MARSNSCPDHIVFFHPNSKYHQSLGNITGCQALAIQSVISFRHSPLAPSEVFGIFATGNVAENFFEGESRDLTGGKVGVIAEAFKMCHDLREER